MFFSRNVSKKNHTDIFFRFKRFLVEKQIDYKMSAWEIMNKVEEA